jgi:hypothetical protein
MERPALLTPYAHRFAVCKKKRRRLQAVRRRRTACNLLLYSLRRQAA